MIPTRFMLSEVLGVPQLSADFCAYPTEVVCTEIRQYDGAGDFGRMRTRFYRKQEKL